MARYPTKVFESYAHWQAAGSPVGGVFPLEPEWHYPAHPETWPERYRDGRPIYYVALPNGQTWCPWRRAYSRPPKGAPMESGYHGEGWDVSGTPDCLTAKPSINAGEGKNNWHGFLTNGELIGP